MPAPCTRAASRGASRSRLEVWARLLALVLILILNQASVALAAPPNPARPSAPASSSTPASPTAPPPPPPTLTIPPAPDRWVSDRAGVLSPATEQALDRRLATYEQQTGHQVIVWIGESTGALPIERFAVEAFAAWKIGRTGLDDGLAVFVMVEDRTIRIEVGYGLEPTVTDLLASRVIREIMIPDIQAGDWDQAIAGGVEALLDVIEGRGDPLGPAPAAGTPTGGSGAGQGGAEGVPEARGPPEPPWMRTAKIVGIVILVIGFVILLIVNPRLALLLLFFAGRGGGRGGGGGGGFGGGGGRSGGGGASGGW